MDAEAFLTGISRNRQAPTDPAVLSDNAHYDITPMRRAAVANITCIDSHPLTPVAPPTSLASGVTPTGESGADVVRRQHEHGAQPFPSRLRDAPRVGQVVGVEL